MKQKKCNLSKTAMLKDIDACLDSEIRALTLYQILLPLLKNKNDEAKISAVIKDEERHIEIVKNLREVVEIYYKK